MKSSKAQRRGIDAFQTYFSEMYKERWPHLLEALHKPPIKSALICPFANLSEADLATLESSASERCPQPFRTSNDLLSHYAMDKASILAAHALPIKSGDRILDMCAAPGGKALALIFRTDASNQFVLNERSATRRARLQSVIEDYVPQELNRDIRITSHDATKWCLHEKDAYDAILLDAPCSSERHLLEKPTLMTQWSPHRTYALALQQFAMLASAGAAVKPGGSILYATCSISKCENDDVIAKLLKKRDQFNIVPLHYEFGEATKHGWIFLPDSTGMGPLYLSLIRRKI